MKKERLQLKQVTLVAVTSVKIYETVRALLYSMKEVEYADVILLSHEKPAFLPKSIRFVEIEQLKNIDDYSHFCVYDLGDYIETPFALIVHHDGFVVNPGAWREEFLQYDYIGSPWPIPKDEVRYRDTEGNLVRVGNGVSLRSKRLMEFAKQNHLPWEKTDSGDYNEDCFLCCKNKLLLEKKGMKFAPLEIAVYFGREHTIPENEAIEPFLFHQWRGKNKKYPRFVNVPEKAEKRFLKLIVFFLSKLGFEITEAKQQELIQAIRYLAVGVYNMLLSYLVYDFFVLAGCGYLLGNALSFCFSVLNSFFCSQKFVFHGQNKWYIMLGKVALSYVGTGLILQSFLLYIWVEQFGVSPFLAPILNICIITPLNFILQKFWAYK